MSGNQLNHVRSAALNRIERIERNFKAMFVLGALVEAAFLIGFVLLANFKDRLHLLLLLSTVAVYTILVLGLFALGAHVSRCAERILKAIDLTQPAEDVRAAGRPS